MTRTTDPYKSRWGFHPCSYELFVKLRCLHKQYWQTVYAFHRWHRWWRKEPQNRTSPEPGFCPAFVLDEPWYKPVRLGGVDGFKVYPRKVVDHGVVELYHAARRPRPEPVEPFDAETIGRIERLTSEVAKHFEA